MCQLLLGSFSILGQLAVALLYTFAMPAAHAHEGNHQYEHQVTKAAGGDFTLAAASGPVALNDFHGKVVTIYFGYTRCKDICPLDLGKLGSALKSMKAAELGGIQPLFVTLDPARDDAQKMAAYSEGFHPKLVGLTGSEDEIAAVAKSYGVSYDKGAADATGAYDIAHPSDVFIVARNGKLVGNLPPTTTESGIVAALRKALKAKDR